MKFGKLVGGQGADRVPCIVKNGQDVEKAVWIAETVHGVHRMVDGAEGQESCVCLYTYSVYEASKVLGSTILSPGLMTFQFSFHRLESIRAVLCPPYLPPGMSRLSMGFVNISFLPHKCDVCRIPLLIAMLHHKEVYHITSWSCCQESPPNEHSQRSTLHIFTLLPLLIDLNTDMHC